MRWLLGVALFGLAQWFFGNAYEQVVLGPNFAFGDSLKGLTALHGFFINSNPIYYYVPLDQISIISLFVALYAARSDVPRRRLLIRSSVFAVLATVLSVYIVTQINLRIFFGPLPADASTAHSLAVTWVVLNPVRMALVAIAFVYALQAWIRSLRVADGWTSVPVNTFGCDAQMSKSNICNL